MSKRNQTPAPAPRSRLVFLGGAKDRTNAGGGFKVEELDPEIKYNPS